MAKNCAIPTVRQTSSVAGSSQSAPLALVLLAAVALSFVLCVEQVDSCRISQWLGLEVDNVAASSEALQVFFILGLAATAGKVRSSGCTLF